MVLSQVYEGLVKFGPDFKIQPAIAEKWDISPDRKTYTFHLRKNVKFHNNQLLTAEDIKWTFERACNPELYSPTAANILGDVVGVRERLEGKSSSVSGVKVIGPHTVKISLKEPKPYFVAKLAAPIAWILPKTIPIDTEIKDIKQVIGTGPFKLAEHHRQQLVVLKPHSDYYVNPPMLAGIEIPVLKDPITIMNNYEVGTLHYCRVPAIEAASIDSTHHFYNDVRDLSLAGVYYFELNPQAYAPFKDRNVRRAITMSIDRDRMVRDVLRNSVKRAHSLVHKDIPGHRKKTRELPFNPEMARKLLRETPYKDGSKLPLLNLYVRADSQTARTACENVAIQLKKHLGVKVRVSQVEWISYQRKVQQKRVPFRLALRIMDYPDPSNILKDLFTTDSPLNYCGYSNRQFDEWCALADSHPKQAHRLKLYAQAEDTLLQDAYVLPLFYPKDYWLISKKMHGWRHNALVGFMCHSNVCLSKL